MMNQFVVVNGYLCIVDTSRYDFFYGFAKAIKNYTKLSGIKESNLKTVINLINENDCVADDAMLAAVLVRCILHYPQVANIDVYISQRAASGWLEYLMVLTYHNGAKLTIGAIQRMVGGSYEFHS
jgi:hypothetical protein